MRQRKFYASRLLAITAMLLAVSGIALADIQQIDGDLTTTGLDNVVNLNASAGATVNTSAQVVIRYNTPQHLSPDDVVPFVVSASQTDLPSGYSVASVAITIPDPWDGSVGPGGDGRVGATSAISFTAPSVAGSYTYTVKYQVDKSGSYPSCIDNNPSCLTDSPGGGPAFTINLDVTGGCTVTSYTATWYQPIDPSSLILNSQKINTTKLGRVVPLKVTLVDNCGDAVLPTSGKDVSVRVNETNVTSGVLDAVEQYADAGQANNSTFCFRWSSTDSFWIYNLDTNNAGSIGKLVAGKIYSAQVGVASDAGNDGIATCTLTGRIFAGEYANLKMMK